MKKTVFSISRINNYIRALMEDDVILSDLFVEGEISNFKRHSSGHLYFTLKDAKAAINCVMFRSDAALLDFSPVNGQNVLAYGRVSVFEKTGQYQLYIEVMQKAGLGALYEKFEALKEKLAGEGLFDERHKQPLPEFPGTVALVTSPTGAAVRDMIKVIKARNAAVKIVVVPAVVQGETAGKSIAAALESANRWGKADVVILGRGGGSMEDLWAFNEEVVARAVYASRIPVVSAVGHETDFTICDFVADKRAATPSNAGEICVPDRQALVWEIEENRKRLNYCLDSLTTRYKERLRQAVSRPVLADPLKRVYDNALYIGQLSERLDYSMDKMIERKGTAFTSLAGALEKVSPMGVLKRGYGAVTKADGSPVTGVNNLLVGAKVRIHFADGHLAADVTQIIKDDGFGKEDEKPEV